MLLVLVAYDGAELGGCAERLDARTVLGEVRAALAGRSVAEVAEVERPQTALQAVRVEMVVRVSWRSWCFDV